jgi:hypothetical protein
LHKWNNKQNIYDSSGKLLPDEKADELSTLLWKVIEDAQEYSAKSSGTIPTTASLYDFFVEKSKEIFPGDPDTVKLLCQMSEMWGAYIGDPIERQSLRFAWMEEVCGGGETFSHAVYCFLSFN